MQPIARSTEEIVKDRYSRAARSIEPALCCATDAYDSKHLAAIPSEVIEKDYGCGNPAACLKPGETVLDLGSGAGKICFIAAQVVGLGGRVIGIDMTDEMLEVARRNAPIVARQIGYANVEFRKGRIQDLALDVDRLAELLSRYPITDSSTYLAAEDRVNELRATAPLVPSETIDTVVSSCVLNLVESSSKPRLFAEIYRVLKRGGRAVISDIVAGQPVPERLQSDPELWSGCISGALTESDFLESFRLAGFSEVRILSRQSAPWRVVDGIEFRSLTVEALKGKTQFFKPFGITEATAKSRCC